MFSYKILFYEEFNLFHLRLLLLFLVLILQRLKYCIYYTFGILIDEAYSVKTSEIIITISTISLTE